MKIDFHSIVLMYQRREKSHFDSFFLDENIIFRIYFSQVISFVKLPQIQTLCINFVEINFYYLNKCAPFLVIRISVGLSSIKETFIDINLLKDLRLCIFLLIERKFKIVQYLVHKTFFLKQANLRYTVHRLTSLNIKLLKSQFF